MTVPRFGDVPPPQAAPGEALVEAGWHPLCGHVRHLALGERIGPTLAPGLIYGLLARDLAVARQGECDQCRVPPQQALGL